MCHLGHLSFWGIFAFCVCLEWCHENEDGVKGVVVCKLFGGTFTCILSDYLATDVLCFCSYQWIKIKNLASCYFFSM